MKDSISNCIEENQNPSDDSTATTTEIISKHSITEAKFLLGLKFREEEKQNGKDLALENQMNDNLLPVPQKEETAMETRTL